MESSPTERLYYADSCLTEFDAIVLAAARHDGRWVVVLDRTAFYPASGGQPFDTGTLGDAHVLEVQEHEDGSIRHLVDRELSVGRSVHGVVDWGRRFDHMQQHTGQHLLSAAFDRLHGARTVGFHLGAASSTIDLDRDLPPALIVGAEDAANRIVWEDRPVSIRFATEDEAASLPLRKEATRGGVLRLIEIVDCDLSACGGTHVGRTGAVGMIAVASWERFKGGVRIEFLCGGRALRSFRALRDAIAGSVRLLSVLPEELPAAVERLQAESKSQKKTQQALQVRLASHEAGALALRGAAIGPATLVAEALSEWDAQGLKSLASTITSAPGFIVTLVSTDSPALIVIARSQDVAMDASAILRRITERFGGRGGGKSDLAQGGGLSGSAGDILAAAREAVAQSITTS